MEAVPHNGRLRHIADIILPPLFWLLCRTLGILTWWFSYRRGVAIRNLALAFPEKDAAWHRRIAFRSILRMFELFVVPTLAPWLSDDNLRRRLHFTPQSILILDKLKEEGPAIILTTHSASAETLTIAPLLYPGLKFTTIYRPLDLRFADRLTHMARTQWGMNLVSRKDGLLGLSHAITRGESVCMLFDQNTLTAGTVILSFNRVCLATDLPGILASRLNKKTYLVLAKRKGFLKAEFEMYPVETDGSVAEITAKANFMLDNLVKRDDDTCADWMWAHQRWRNYFCRVNQCLSLSNKKNYLAEYMRIAGLSALPRRQPFILRIPDNPVLAKITAGWMPKLREARPDVRWIVLANEDAAQFFHEGENCEKLVRYTASTYRQTVHSLRSEYAEVYMVLEPDVDAEKERRQSDSQRALGITSSKRTGKRGTVYFHASKERFHPESFDRLLDEVFQSCGLGK